MNVSPIQKLVLDRCNELQISVNELISKSSYSHPCVAYKRLQQLFQCDFKASRGLIAQLPFMLDIPKELLKNSLIASQQQLADEASIQYQQAFKPYYLIRTSDNGKPRQIFIAVFLDAAKYVSDVFPDDLPSGEFIPYAISAYQKHSNQINQLYYEPLDIVINYAYDSADVVTLDGQLIKTLDKAVKTGNSTYQFK